MTFPFVARMIPASAARAPLKLKHAATRSAADNVVVESAAAEKYIVEDRSSEPGGVEDLFAVASMSESMAVGRVRRRPKCE